MDPNDPQQRAMWQAQIQQHMMQQQMGQHNPYYGQPGFGMMPQQGYGTMQHPGMMGAPQMMYGGGFMPQQDMYGQHYGAYPQQGFPAHPGGMGYGSTAYGSFAMAAQQQQQPQQQGYYHPAAPQGMYPQAQGEQFNGPVAYTGGGGSAEAVPPPPPPPEAEARTEGKASAGSALKRDLPLGMKPGGTVEATDIFLKPGRSARPDKICVIMRGLPGSGKSHLAKMLRDIEKEEGGACRILCLDDYFLQEVLKEERDANGVMQKVSVLEYQFEQEMEAVYMQSHLKAFRKTLDEGLFKCVVVDSINLQRAHLEQFWTYAKAKGFEVYVVELSNDVKRCTSRNIHGWDEASLERMMKDWEPTPQHMTMMKVQKLLGEKGIEEVEMGDDDEEGEVVQAKEEVYVTGRFDKRYLVGVHDRASDLPECCVVCMCRPKAASEAASAEATAGVKSGGEKGGEGGGDEDRQEDDEEGDGGRPKRSRWDSDDDDQDSDAEGRESLAQQLKRKKRGASVGEVEAPKKKAAKSVQWSDPLDDLALFNESTDVVGAIKRQKLDHLKGLGLSAAQLLRKQAEQKRQEADVVAARLSFFERARKEQTDFREVKAKMSMVGEEGEEGGKKVPWTKLR